MTSQAAWTGAQEFEWELLGAIDLIQNIILSLRTVDEELNYLLRETCRYRSKRPEIFEMRYLSGGCIPYVLQALDVACELRFKHEQLFDFFAAPQTFIAKPYGLVFQIQGLHDHLFSEILAIRMLLEETELQFRSLQRARKLQSRLRKVVRCIRDLLTLAAPATGFIPQIGPLISGACGVGAGLAAIAYERMGGERDFQFFNIHAAVQQTPYMRNTLSDILACRSVLNSTTNHALFMMAEYDAVEERLALRRQTMSYHQPHGG